MKGFFMLVIMLFLGFNSIAQIGSEGEWDTYIANYEGEKPGSTILRMDLIEKAPIKGYGKVLITGVSYNSTRDDGFPDNEALGNLYEVNEELEVFLNEDYEAILVGSFTQDYKRLNYFYIKTDIGLERALVKFYSINFPKSKFHIDIIEDPQWGTYVNFLYPNEAILEYISDRRVVETLIEAGDPLTEIRRVDHWLWFEKEEEVQSFIKKVELIGYKLEGYNKVESVESLYSVKIWKKELPDLDSIYEITTNLRKIAKEDNGTYDGWETFIVKE